MADACFASLNRAIAPGIQRMPGAIRNTGSMLKILAQTFLFCIGMEQAFILRKAFTQSGVWSIGASRYE